MLIPDLPMQNIRPFGGPNEPPDSAFGFGRIAYICNLPFSDRVEFCGDC